MCITALKEKVIACWERERKREREREREREVDLLFALWFEGESNYWLNQEWDHDIITWWCLYCKYYNIFIKSILSTIVYHMYVSVVLRDGCIIGWMDEWIDGWMNGWMDE